MAKMNEDCGGVKPIVVKRSATADKKYAQNQKAAKKDTKKK